MIRHVSLVAMALSFLVAPLSAELRYTMKMEAHASKVPPATPPNPLMMLVSPMVMGMIAPPGGVEMTVTAGDRGVRVEFTKAYATVPAGGAMIVAPDGSLTVINPVARTYWKSRQDSLGSAPTVSLKPSGESASIAGVRAERSDVEIRLPLPIAAGMPGIPTELVTTGEVWLADRYKNYASMASGLAAVGLFGTGKMAATGLLMRSILRSDLFGNQEIESVVTSIGEVTVPAATFQVPAGYMEVEAPSAAIPPVLSR